MEKVILEFKGYSGSKIFLMQSNKEIFVRKIGNVSRNYERLTFLNKLGYPVVRILDYKNDTLDLEYISGIDIKNYLIQQNPKPLADFIISIINNLKSTNTTVKDYNDVYEKKLESIIFDFSFSKKELLDKLPKKLDSSQYFGDLTLENILFNKHKGFIIIDPATIEYDSWIFDLAKLNQDLTCKWFLRNDRTNLDAKIKILKNYIEKEYGEMNNILTILMLLRIYRHVGTDIKTKNFLDRQINLLWK